FQAEDGIRDKLVTGVQTCALPISAGATACCKAANPLGVLGNVPPASLCPSCQRAAVKVVLAMSTPIASMGKPPRGGQRPRPAGRSEERRVGKECRCGWAAGR